MITKKKWSRQKKFNHGNIRQLILLLTYSHPEDVKITPDEFKNIFSTFTESVDLSVVLLRFMFSKSNWSTLVFELAVTLLMKSDCNLLNYIQLAALVEFTSESVFSMNDERVSKRQKQVDKILSDCYQCHYEFWYSVLHSNMSNIGYCAYRLTKVIKNAENFFIQNNINEYSDDLYRAKYIEFITSVTANLTSVDYDQLTQKYIKHEQVRYLPTLTTTFIERQNNQTLARSHREIKQKRRHKLSKKSNTDETKTTKADQKKENKKRKIDPKKYDDHNRELLTKDNLPHNNEDYEDPYDDDLINMSDETVPTNNRYPIFGTEKTSFPDSLKQPLNNSSDDSLINNLELSKKESFPQFDVVSNQINHFSDDRLQICKEANNYKFKNQVCRYVSLIVFSSVVFCLTFLCAAIFFVATNDPFNERTLVDSFYNVLFAEFDTSFSFLNQYLKFVIYNDGNLDQIKNTTSHKIDLFLEIISEETDSLPFISTEKVNTTLQNIWRYLDNEISYFELTRRLIVGFNFLLEFVDDREKSLIRYNNTYTSTIIYLALALSIFLVITLIIFSFILLDQVRVIDILSYRPILISKHEIMALYNKYWQMAPNSQQIVSYHTLSFTAYYNINLLILVVISFAVHFVFMFVSVVIHQNIVQQDLSIYNLAISMPIFRSSLFFIAMLNFDRDKISIMKHNILREYAALQSLNTDSDYQNNNSFHDNVVINCFHPEHIYPLQTMHFWPLNDKSISIEFSDYISQVAIILYEIQFSTHNGIYQSSIDPLIQLPITSLALKNSAKESYNFKTTITIMEAIVAFLLYFILQVIIFASEIVMITDIHSTFNLMARLLCLMPQKSPFFEIPIDLERPMPDSHDSDLIENMSNGIIVCDSSFTIRRMNSTAKCMFGSKYKGKKIQKVPEKVVDPISGKTKYYSIHLCTRAQNPIDDFERRLFNDRTLCFIINDMSQAFTLKTKITNMKNEKLYLINELLPSSIEMIRNESIRMVVKFAIVEISFSKEFKQFEKFTEDVTKVSEQFSTLFLLTTKRFSFFAIFVNFSTGGNSRQFIREAISFVTRIMGFAFNFAKASLVLGDRCLLMDEKSENMHFELFSQALMMSAALLRLANIGEIVSDYNIFKSVKNPSIQISRVGTQLILSDYYEFCVVSIQI